MFFILSTRFIMNTILLIIIAVLVIRSRSNPTTSVPDPYDSVAVTELLADTITDIIETTTTIAEMDSTTIGETFDATTPVVTTLEPYSSWHTPLNLINWTNLTSWAFGASEEDATTTMNPGVTTTEEPSSFNLFNTLDSTRQNFMLFLAKGLSEAHKQEEKAKKLYHQELDRIRNSQDILRKETERRLNFTRSYFRSINLAVIPSVF